MQVTCVFQQKYPISDSVFLTFHKSANKQTNSDTYVQTTIATYKFGFRFCTIWKGLIKALN